MTNKLIIENFLIFDHVEIDVNRYTVFIGPQASGKSVVAKILYLFYQLPKKCFSLLDKKDIVKNTIQEMTQEFGKVFLERLWRAHTFSIRLQTASGFLEYKYKPNDDIVFSMSENYLSLISSLGIHRSYSILISISFISSAILGLTSITFGSSS